ncbi:VOC family protein [Trebonia kvetii]|uniref:VOC family protein n=1 Tax=Trebonia kvetii TaxID=2480626 RepID=A0A6P2C6I2_9ACTN|nr:VOC family protein [Trebonia kvetii]TVZ06888.1 VOC family protein [Trebonia kvetii]
MPAKVGYLMIDAARPAALAGFWCGLLALSTAAESDDGDYLVLSPTEDGLTLGFQRVADAKLGKNRLHLDLMVDDLDEVTAEVERLGGRWLEPGTTRDLDEFRWRCMADPEGNEFDIAVLTS